MKVRSEMQYNSKMFLWKNSTDIDYISDAIKVIDEGLFILLLSFILLIVIYVDPSEPERVRVLHGRRTGRKHHHVRADGQRRLHRGHPHLQVQDRFRLREGSHDLLQRDQVHPHAAALERCHRDQPEPAASIAVPRRLTRSDQRHHLQRLQLIGRPQHQLPDQRHPVHRFDRGEELLHAQAGVPRSRVQQQQDAATRVGSTDPALSTEATTSAFSSDSRST